MVIAWSHSTNPGGGDFQAIEYDEATQRVYASCHCFNQVYSRNDGGTNTIFRGVGWGGWTGVVSDVDWVLAADAGTGALINTFQPDFSGQAGPWALHTAPNGCLWVGGGISATNGLGQRSLTKICDPALLDSVRPSTPTGLQAANPTASTVDLDWNPSTDNVGVVGYEIYDSVTNTVIGESTPDQVMLTGLSAGSYSVYVKARDADGNRSWRSGIVSFDLTGADTVRPTAPRGLNIDSAAGGSVSLVWIGSTDNVGVVGYQVYDVATQTVVATTTGTSTSIPHVAGQAIAVKAVDAAGNLSYRSNSVTL